jgi:hypothetical protein
MSMNAFPDGGPAFPMQDQSAIHAWAQARIEALGLATTAERDAAYIQARAEAIGGMSLRDYFAAKAMQGELASMQDPEADVCGVALDAPDVTFDRLARHYYRLADAMLKARKKGGAA